MVLAALVAAAFIGYNGQPYAGLELVNELSDPLSDVAFSASVGTPSCLAVKGSYAFVVGDPYRSLAIVDISDRASPTVVGALRSPYVLAIDYRDSVITEKGCDAAAIGGGPRLQRRRRRRPQHGLHHVVRVQRRLLGGHQR